MIEGTHLKLRLSADIADLLGPERIRELVGSSVPFWSGQESFAALVEHAEMDAIGLVVTLRVSGSVERGPQDNLL